MVGELGCVGEHIKVWEAAGVAMMVVIGDEPSTSMSYRRFLSVVDNAF